MGLFSGIKDARDAVNFQNDTEGTYWQVLHEVRMRKTQKDQKPFCKIKKQVVKVVDNVPGVSLNVGAEPGHAIFAGPYFQSDFRALLKSAFGEDVFNEIMSEAAKIEAEAVAAGDDEDEAGDKVDAFFKKMLKDGLVDGRVVSCRAYISMSKEKGKPGEADYKPPRPFLNVRYNGHVTDGMLRENLDAETLKRFGLLQK